MKSLEQLYQEIMGDEKLKEAFVVALKENKVEDFLKALGCEATTEDVMKYLNSQKEGALSDDDMEKVAGGGCTSYSCNMTCGCTGIPTYC